MSDKTKQVMEDAIKAHFSDESSGGFMVDYIMVAAGVSPNDAHETGYMYECDVSSAPHSLYGLGYMAADYWSIEGDEE